MLFAILSTALFPLSAEANQNVHISFVLFDANTNKSVGSGSQVILNLVNRGDNQQHVTDQNGVVSFDISPLDYVLTSYCSTCQLNFQSNSGTQYLISPQNDGTVRVLSAEDKPVNKDNNGNYIIETNIKREINGTDPWQLLKNQPNFGGGPEHMYLMTNGKVLMQVRDRDGFDKWWLLTPDKKGSYIDGTWTQISSPASGYNPQNMNGVVLHSGKFMIVGGEQNTNASGKMEENTNQSFLYDVVGNSWSSVPAPQGGAGDWANIGASPFIELADGRVMVGHNGSSNQAGLSAALYDETSGNWTITGTNKNTSNNEEGYTLMANDKVLNVWNGDDNISMLGTAESYDPASGLWTKTTNAPVATGHGEIGPAISLPNGKVLQMGATGKNVLYDPATNSWTSVPDFPKLSNGLQLTASDDESVVLPNGNVLVITSVFTCSTQNCWWMGPAKWFEYSVSTNAWLSVPDDPIISSAANIANGVQVLSLPNGQVMMSGEGHIAFYNSSTSSNASYSPLISDISATSLSPNNTYKLSGKQLAGLTQGTAWGDEQQNQTNYGLVQITNKKTGDVSYARSFNFSSTSIAPNIPSTLSFTVDPKIENGNSSLRVIASGFASLPFDVTITGGIDLPSAVAQSTNGATNRNSTKTSSQSNISQGSQTLVQTTIFCAKGSAKKKVTGLKPHCPSGYKLSKH